MLQVDRLRVAFGDVVALDEASLDAPAGSTTVLMGPSGCGKSTLLRVVAGLERAATGSVTWDGRAVGDVATHKRGFGLMFQDYALFPHRSVGDNVGFGLRMLGHDDDATAGRVAEVLDLVGLAGSAARPIVGLSGGEQQRVALARSLAPSPRLLMLDEPIGSLDRDLRSQLMVEMRRIFADLALTVLYVTHDVDEAFALADRVAVMRAGRIVRAGSPAELWTDPGSRFVARFMGRDNVLDHVDAARLAQQGLLASSSGGVAIPPEAIHISTDVHGDATVRESVFVTGVYRVTVDVFGVELLVQTAKPMAAGSTVRATVDRSEVVELGDC